jgi:hypothetical protein
MFGEAPCARLFEAPLRGETTDRSSGDDAAAADDDDDDDDDDDNIDENDGDDVLPGNNSRAACRHAACDVAKRHTFATQMNRSFSLVAPALSKHFVRH